MSPADELSPAALQALLQAAARKLGATPQQVEQAARSGRMEPLLQGASPALAQALRDPEAAQKLLASPQGQKLLAALQKGNS